MAKKTAVTEAPAVEPIKSPDGLTLEHMARVCHEANRGYCQAIGDTSQVSWEGAEQWQKDSAIAGVEFFLKQGGCGPGAQHAAWMADKIADGWTVGPVKDAAKKQHPCLVPFNELPKEQQAKDFIFVGVMNGLRVLIGR